MKILGYLALRNIDFFKHFKQKYYYTSLKKNIKDSEIKF